MKTSRLYREALQKAEEAWLRVQADELGVYASADILYQNAVFGRDSIEVAEDLLLYKPEVVRKIIFALARLQGLSENPITEEEPGKIHHEYRRTIQSVSSTTRQYISNWGAVNDELHYFGAIDATPLFVRLVLNYCRAYGDSLMYESYVHKNGSVFTVKQCIEMAVSWIEKKLDMSDLALIEYKRINPNGIRNQIWTDSIHATIHDDGNTSNFEFPIAPIEVQGYAYDALVQFAYWCEAKDPARAHVLRERARALQNATIDSFWMKEHSYFALGIDRDSHGHPRHIKTLSSNPGLLLDTDLISDLPAHRKKSFVTSIIKKLISQEFLTSAGIRCRSIAHVNLLKVRRSKEENLLFPYTDYQGSRVVWFKQTYDIAKGLRRYGFILLAQELEARIFNTVAAVSGHYEFVYVDEEGYILIPREHILEAQTTEKTLYATNVPERDQSWTVSAILAIVSNMVGSKHERRNPDDSWAVESEQQMIKTIPHMPFFHTKKQIDRIRRSTVREAYFVKVTEDLVISSGQSML